MLLLAVAALAVVAALVFLLGGEPAVPPAGATGSGPAPSTPAAARTASGVERESVSTPRADPGSARPGQPLEREVTALGVEVVSASGTPVAGVEVFVYPSIDSSWPRRRTATTDPAGVARFAPLEPGVVHVEAAAGGPRMAVELPPGREANVTIAMPAGGAVEGRVIDPAGRGIAGAQVWLSGAWDDARGGVVARTDARGRFELRDVGRGRHVAAWARGFAASPVFPVRGEAGSRSQLSITLSPASGAVEGIVVDERGKPVPEALIVVGADERAFDRRGDDGSRAAGPAPREVRTGSDGRFGVRHLEPGQHPMVVVAGGHAPAVLGVTVQVGATESVRVSLTAGAVVHGTCRGADGAPVAHVEVATRDVPRAASRHATSDVDGRYRLVDVVVGEVALAATAPSVTTPVTTTLVTHSGRTLQWDPVFDAALDPAEVVTGRVVGPDGRGLPNHRVVAEPDPPARATPVSRLTGSDGTFRLAVPWERVRLLVFGDVSASGFPVAVAAGIPRGAGDVELVVQPATLSGVRARVIDSAGMPVAATLQVWHQDARVWREVPSQPGTGVVELVPMLPGTCTIEIRSPDHPWLRLDAQELPRGRVLELGDLVLEPGARVEGNVTFVDGGAPGSLTLRFVDEDAGREVGAAEVREGRFRSNPLPAKPLVMIVEGDGIASTRVPLALSPATPLRVIELSVERGVPVTLRLALPPAMERPQWLHVGVFRDREPVWTRGLGRATAAEVTIGLAPGAYRVIVQSTQPLADMPIEVGGRPVTFDVPLRPR